MTEALWIVAIGIAIRLLQQQRKTMAKVSELAGKFTALGDQVDKIIAEIKTLKDSLKDADLPADAEASLARLTGLIQTADDENPDAPAPTT